MFLKSTTEVFRVSFTQYNSKQTLLFGHALTRHFKNNIMKTKKKIWRDCAKFGTLIAMLINTRMLCVDWILMAYTASSWFKQISVVSPTGWFTYKSIRRHLSQFAYRSWNMIQKTVNSMQEIIQSSEGT